MATRIASRAVSKFDNPLRVMNTKFITQNELSREARVPVNRIQSAVEVGLICPVGRAGTSRNAPLIFDAEDLPRLVDALHTGTSFRAGGAPQPKNHQCQSTLDVMAKYEALKRASEEGEQ